MSSLPLELSGSRWRRIDSQSVSKLRVWLSDELRPFLDSGDLPDASPAIIAELLSACLWSEAFVSEEERLANDGASDGETSAFIASVIATHCLDIDDALRCLNMRNHTKSLQWLLEWHPKPFHTSKIFLLLFKKKRFDLI